MVSGFLVIYLLGFICSLAVLELSLYQISFIDVVEPIDYIMTIVLALFWPIVIGVLLAVELSRR